MHPATRSRSPSAGALPRVLSIPARTTQLRARRRRFVIVRLTPNAPICSQAPGGSAEEDDHTGRTVPLDAALDRLYAARFSEAERRTRVQLWRTPCDRF